MIPELHEDYFPCMEYPRRDQSVLNFWHNLPHEIKISVLSHLSPRELVRVSIVSKSFHKDCLDGQLWTRFDASEFYEDIPAESLAKIIVAAGPFIKDLNLRGCVQIEHYKRAEVVVQACQNLIKATLEGCKNFQRSALHDLLKSNSRLANLNLTGLNVVTNATCMIIARSCPQLEILNVSWCNRMDARGIRSVVLGCPGLRDLRAGEVSGFNNLELARDIFRTNQLEKLVLGGCKDLTDTALQTMFWGDDPEMDLLTNIPIVPPRRLRHLDLTRCTQLTSKGVARIAHLVPKLQGLQLNGCTSLTDEALIDIFATTPELRLIDLEELSNLTNALLSDHLTHAPCAPHLEHISISYCENLGDVGVLPVIQACTSLTSIEMDNTRISDLALLEAAAMVRARSATAPTSISSHSLPRIGLSMVIYDCQNVTWTGVREVLSRNTSPIPSSSVHTRVALTPQTIRLKTFHQYQQTVDEHTKRVLRGQVDSAKRLEKMWAEYMMASEEAGAPGTGARRRRRRAREARMMIADEEGGDALPLGLGRRRRARSGAACLVM